MDRGGDGWGRENGRGRVRYGGGEVIGEREEGVAHEAGEGSEAAAETRCETNVKGDGFLDFSVAFLGGSGVFIFLFLIGGSLR